jgi:hypothetical protein
MQISLSPQPVVALIAGIVILLVPRLLNYIVAIYLIVFGILGLIRRLAGQSSIARESGKASKKPHQALSRELQSTRYVTGGIS